MPKRINQDMGDDHRPVYQSDMRMRKQKILSTDEHEEQYKVKGLVSAQLQATPRPHCFLRAHSPVTPDLLRSQRKLEMQIFTETEILSR